MVRKKKAQKTREHFPVVFSHSLLPLCGNKRYHLLHQKILPERNRSFQAHKTFGSMMKADLELAAAAQPRRLSPTRDPPHRNGLQQHAGSGPCCVADGFFLFVESCKVVQNKFVLRCSQFQPEPSRLFPESSKPM